MVIEIFQKTESIAKRLIMIVMVISSFFLVESAGLFFVTHAFSKSLTELNQINILGNLNRQIRQLMAAQRDVLERVHDSGPTEEGRTVFRAASAKSLELTDQLLASVEQDAALSPLVRISREAMVQLTKMEDDLFRGGNVNPHLVIAKQYVLEAMDNLTRTSILQREQSETIFAEVYSQRLTPFYVSLGLGLFFIFFAVALGLKTSRAIGYSIGTLLQGTAKVASGDLSYRVPIIQQDEVGRLADAFNHMTTTLQETTVSKDQLTQSNLALASANRELESFSYSVSHDLRAPLRSIDGFSQALLEDYGDKLDTDAKDFLDRIRAATQRMGNLIDDMLNLSRLSRVEMNLRPVDLSEMAKGIINELHEAEPGREVEFTAQPGAVVQADEGMMKILLTNLLGNAWKYSSKKPSAKIEFGRGERGGHEMFYVRDNGAGFDMAYSNKLFGAFQRLHSHSEFAGTGVGLATVQRIVSRHGGWVEAEGRVNGGATFYFMV